MESQDIRDNLLYRMFLEGIYHSQVMLDLRQQIGESHRKIEKRLYRALHLEAVNRIEEDGY